MSKAKLRLAFACVLILVAFLVGVFSRSVVRERGRQEIVNKLQSTIEAKRRVSGSIRLKDVTNFEWDKVHIFAPYTSMTSVDQGLGFAWPEARKTHIDMLDSFNLLVFTRQGKVVNYIKYPLQFGDFSRAAIGKQQKGLSPDEAVFVEEYYGNTPWLIHRPPGSP